MYKELFLHVALKTLGVNMDTQGLTAVVYHANNWFRELPQEHPLSTLDAYARELAITRVVRFLSAGNPLTLSICRELYSPEAVISRTLAAWSAGRQPPMAGALGQA
jgi:hypothetical protein